MRICLFAIVAVTLAAFASPFARTSRAADEILPPIDQRFADLNGEETPDFQRHVSPLFGRLGCNGRSCHGSFQGRGGFRLSLFGYDFQADLDALNDKESPRIDKENPVESLMLVKPADADLHEGGERFKTGSWQYNVFRRWLEAGAKFDSAQVKKLERLEVQPAELLFSDKGQQVQLRAVAVWEDGTREDVTPLCRFQSNSDQVALIDEHGLVTSAEPGDTHLVAFYDNAVVPVPVIRPVSNVTGDKYPATPTFNRVDELVLEKLRKLGVVQSETASDGEFLRRLSLDMTGTLPTSEETAAFLADQSPDKRARKIDQLLESPAYAAWWTTRLCDFTGNNDAQIRNVSPQGVRGVTPSQHWYDWIHKRVVENSPYDQLVEGILVATSREEGQSYAEFCETMSTIFANKEGASFAELSSMPYFWAKQDLRVPEARSIAVAYSFLGIRIQCAQCHKHPFDQWSKQDFEQFTNFFRHVNYSNGRPRDGKEREEYDAILAKLNIDPELRGNQQRRAYGELLAKGNVVPFPELATVSRPITTRGDMAEPLTTPIETARLLGGETLKTEDYEDVRQPLMDWLRRKDNPYFARAFVNRVWAAYFNVGIIEPPDDINLANPPSNKALLDYLAAGFVDSGFDMKWVHRTIANSRTYQLSWRPN
ncbi:MAG: DUF1549 domain-containing protein, partial [Planctomycetales bacterium]|nr:DUF1549 domain-containing protein [Planctomycetales bacterium]